MPRLSLVDELPIVDEVETFVRRFIVLDEHVALIVALWIIHTHCFDDFSETPYLSITSPEKRCGKTRLQQVLGLLCKHPWSAVLPSEAVVYRYIDAHQPTLLLDETDAIFKPGLGDKYEGLRALLNEGNHDAARVSRCVGNSKDKLASFSTFCPKALSGIGTLPDTIVDRSVPVRLERKTREQQIERFRKRDVEPEGEVLRTKIEKWVKRQKLDMRPSVPDELNDRAQDIVEPLVSIADAAGCGDRARAALVSIFTSERADDTESMRLTLLRDVQKVFLERQVRTMPTSLLLPALWEIKESPWRHWYGRCLDERDLAAMLQQFGVHPVNVRSGSKILKGYKQDALHSVWSRYLDVADVAHVAVADEEM